jgi:hypothetical protein
MAFDDYTVGTSGRFVTFGSGKRMVWTQSDRTTRLLSERELLRRLRGWDMLDACADGTYWKGEIDRVLSDPSAGYTRIGETFSRPRSDMTEDERARHGHRGDRISGA